MRWIVHKKDGSTIASNWNLNDVSFRKSWSKDITSIQLQREEDKKLFTLSARKNSKSIFWQIDDFIFDTRSAKSIMIARKILKSLSNDIWIEVSININKEIAINIINDKFGVN